MPRVPGSTFRISTGACRLLLRNVGTNASNPLLVDENGQVVHTFTPPPRRRRLQIFSPPCPAHRGPEPMSPTSRLVQLWAGLPSAIVSSRPHARAAREAALAGPYARVLRQQDRESAEDNTATDPWGWCPPLQNKKMVVPEGMCSCDRTECQEMHRNETAKRREWKIFEALIRRGSGQPGETSWILGLDVWPNHTLNTLQIKYLITSPLVYAFVGFQPKYYGCCNSSKLGFDLKL
ncbi:hypothetical protein B0H16DRAFT_1733352 [Mycena metata]|uniref:Uncharacterized protein n=1 Tax=Mycena metata TaxID=1033252 RepID=A0AAD7MSN1_9AGAR|nr:hypothetical protein B0H16DRAFT_1733352 [Mycena metata]